MQAIANHRFAVLKQLTEEHEQNRIDPHLSNKECVLCDLQRVKFILEDMLHNEEFITYDKEINGKNMYNIESLIRKIDKI